MIFFGDPSDTWSCTFSDIPQQALSLRRYSSIEIRLTTSTDRKGFLKNIDRASKRPRMSKRTKVAVVLNVFATRDEESWIFLGERDRQVGIGLIILELNIKLWIFRFNPSELQCQRLYLASDNCPVNSYCGMDHSVRLGRKL